MLDRLDCAVCAQSRSMLVQSVFGIVQPYLLAALVQTSYAYSSRNPIAPKSKPFSGVWKFHSELFKTNKMLIGNVFLAQILLTNLIAYRQAYDSKKLVMKLKYSLL